MTRLAGSSKGSHKPHRNAIAARLCGLMPGSATVAAWLLYGATRSAGVAQSGKTHTNFREIHAKSMRNKCEIVCEHAPCRCVVSAVLAPS
jgi:hypothetical protein